MSWDLIADIGGTNARFAQVDDDEITRERTFPTKGEHGLLDAMNLYLDDIGSTPNRVVLAAAGTISNGQVKLTNADQQIKITSVQDLCKTKDVAFINDFAAAAWSLATVTQNDVSTIQGEDEIPTGNRLIIGPGTGLGVGMLILTGSGYFAVPGEGGHVRIAPTDAFETTVFDAFKTIWPETQMVKDGLHFEAEAFLSGTGLPYLYQAVCAVMKCEAALNTPKDILKAAQNKSDEAAIKTAKIFQKHLGFVAGDLSLAMSATGGVFIAGGVIAANPWLLDQGFIDAFNNGGRFSKARENTSIYLYQNTRFGLIGAANALGKTG
ncbi:glucokinase [Amylibacter ulvae]|uniref:Glucokinase n=1 Tax=Paramylibacter ulvae TaxID=1651968 RepID=A0ABQ3D8T2_9RHOB|nr:ROK family protein [Amylibacter ulvae]GHA58702.1 glucokinase [Amylibacter ulvae]